MKPPYTMRRSTRVSSASASAPAPLAWPAWNGRIRQLDEQTYEVERSLVRELVTGVIRPGSLRLIPTFDRGALTGIRLLGATAADSLPAAIGLATGDVLVAVNGAPIQSAQQ